MTCLLRLFAVIAFALSSLTPAFAEQQDVTAIARGVVRVVIVATDGNSAYFVGHGSGFAVAPDKVLTNAHVVELLRTEKNLVVGVIPSEGQRSYGGKVIAWSPGNDLALIQLHNARLPVATFFAGAVTDGQHVTAIGYPAAVDRAQGLDLSEMVQPVSPVKTSGTVSTGRASHGFDTVLHTAPMAMGNSGGPLVDDCGRVLGVNSFGSEGENNTDAEFGFAVSNREVASFLRQAGVQFQRSGVPCRSIAELEAEEAKRQQEEFARQQQREAAETAARDKALNDARHEAEQQVYSGRENALAIAGVLLVLSALSFGGAMMFHVEGKERERLWAGIAGGVLLLGACLAFFLRPSFSSIDDRVEIALPPANGSDAVTAGSDSVGDNLCRIDESRSRITVSPTTDVRLNWTAGGCVNRSTQYARDAQGWSRILVPTDEPVVSINSFDPATGTYKVDRYLLDTETADQARQVRSGVHATGCSGDSTAQEQLQQTQVEIRAILPALPNERLVYSCKKVQSGPNE